MGRKAPKTRPTQKLESIEQMVHEAVEDGPGMKDITVRMLIDCLEWREREVVKRETQALRREIEALKAARR
jgi:hypothetical protein